ncbi:hypothetical protein Scep_003852 [Stephania cephalantha]|uniref:Uncharacterized protein n=1 Tax=Stephania cephalantha TaxID=152367 RepID=A0AAP0KSS4_9MAGN
MMTGRNTRLFFPLQIKTFCIQVEAPLQGNDMNIIPQPTLDVYFFDTLGLIKGDIWIQRMEERRSKYSSAIGTTIAQQEIDLESQHAGAELEEEMRAEVVVIYTMVLREGMSIMDLLSVMRSSLVPPYHHLFLQDHNLHHQALILRGMTSTIFNIRLT